MPPESPSLRQVLLVYERVRALSGRLYAQVINQYWQRLQLLTGDGAIAIHIAAQFNPLVFPLSVMDFTSRTLGEAMPRAFEYFNSANPHTRYSSNAQSDRIYLKVAYPRDLGLLHFDAEWRLGIISHAIQWFSQESCKDGVRTVCFRAPRPAHDRELARTLGCPVQFDQPVDAVVVDAKVMETPIWGSESVRLKFTQLVSEAIEETRLATARLSERVALAIRSGLERGNSGIKTVAPQLRMSPRTLQRKLAEEGTHYARILDQTRMNLCIQLLMDSTNFNNGNLAKRLGYSSGSNFDHAFQRWFGTTSGQFRLMGGGASSSARRSPFGSQARAGSLGPNGAA